MPSVSEAFTSGVFAILADVITLAGVVAVMLWIDWRLALVTFAIFPVLFMVAGYFRLRELSDEELIERLTQVRGIGRWTVEMLLIFRLGRPDVLPADDFGVRKGYAVAFGKRSLPKPRELARIGERWAPWRTVAAWYLWRAAAF